MSSVKNYWNDDELKILKNSYENLSYIEIQKLLPNRTNRYIQNKINRLKLSSPKIKWTEQEIKILKKNYNIISKEELLMLLPYRDWRSIKDKACKLSLTKKIIKNKPKRLKKLLDNNIINSNIWGFCLGDAHFCKSGALQIGLSIKDVNYLQYIADYLGGDVKIVTEKYLYKDSGENAKSCKLQIGDKENLNKLQIKLQISNNKTYFPPQDLSFINTDDELLAFYIGLVDSDGTINFKNDKFNYISIGVHINWKSWLELLSNELYKRFGFYSTVNVYNSIKNVAHMTIYRKNIYLQLQQFIIQHNLNHLERKWNKTNV